MTGEAIKRYSASSAGDVVQDYTVADGTGIEKGTLLGLSSPRTAAAATTAAEEPCAGIAAREKVADDGRTQLSVHRQGDFDMVASGAITVGAPVMAAGHGNQVMQALTTSSGASVIGYALETAATAETIQVRLTL